jgi:MFS family permease
MVQQTYPVSPDIINISVSLTSFVTGVFMVVAGKISDRIGKVKMTKLALILSILGSLSLIVSNHMVLLLLGRVLQGFSAAIIMPATIAMINDFFKGEERQKALSFWSIGSFGGTGLASFFAGSIATAATWQTIFIISIIVSLISLFLLKNIPESNYESNRQTSFDYIGLVIFIIMIGSISFIQI